MLWSACIFLMYDAPRNTIKGAAYPFAIEAVSYEEAVGKGQLLFNGIKNTKPHAYWKVVVNKEGLVIVSDVEKFLESFAFTLKD